MESQELTLNVQGMVCGGCENAVETALGQTEGIEQSKADHTKSCVWVRFDPEKTNAAALSQIITTAGYEVVSSAEDDAIATVQVANPSLQHTGSTRLRSALLFIALFIVVGGIVQWGRSLMPNVMTQMNAGVSLATL